MIFFEANIASIAGTLHSAALTLSCSFDKRLRYAIHINPHPAEPGFILKTLQILISLLLRKSSDQFMHCFQN